MLQHMAHNATLFVKIVCFMGPIWPLKVQFWPENNCSTDKQDIPFGNTLSLSPKESYPWES